jgi:hypothetical protein
MNIDKLQDTLLAAARALPSSDHVPYAFEKRIMARLAEGAPVDVWALWSRLLWRAAAPCVGIMLILSAWTVVANRAGGTSDALAADLERTVWGPLSSLEDSW